MTAKKPAGAKPPASSFEEFKANPAAWERKLRRQLARIERDALLDFAIGRAKECEALRHFAEQRLLDFGEGFAEVFLAHGPSESERLHDMARYTDLSVRGLLAAAAEKRAVRQTERARATKAASPTKAQRAKQELLRLRAAGGNIMARDVSGTIAALVDCDPKVVRLARAEILASKTE